MKRTVIAATVLSLAFALPTLAIESKAPADLPTKKPAQSFEERKVQILKHLEDRNTKLQEEKACVQAAKSDEDLRVCRQKSGPPHGSVLQGRPDGSGGPGVPPSKGQ
jgi:hypothetical protein